MFDSPASIENPTYGSSSCFRLCSPGEAGSRDSQWDEKLLVASTVLPLFGARFRPSVPGSSIPGKRNLNQLDRYSANLGGGEEDAPQDVQKGPSHSIETSQRCGESIFEMVLTFQRQVLPIG